MKKRLLYLCILLLLGPALAHAKTCINADESAVLQDKKDSRQEDKRKIKEIAKARNEPRPEKIEPKAENSRPENVRPDLPKRPENVRPERIRPEKIVRPELPGRRGQ